MVNLYDNGMYIPDPTDGPGLGLYILGSLFIIGLFVCAIYIDPAIKRKKLQAEYDEQIRLIEETERQARALAATLKRQEQEAKERQKAAERAARIKDNETYVEDLETLLAAKLELARATEEKSRQETDQYKKIQLSEKASRLYVQANEVAIKIKKLSE